MSEFSEINIEEVYDFIENLGLFRSNIEYKKKTLSELGIDSLELLQLSLEIEKKFHKRLDLESITSASTLEDLVRNFLKQN